MIGTITVGRGNNKTTIELPRNRDERIKLGNVLKSQRLFPDSRSFKQAKARGVEALIQARKNDHNAD